VCSNASSFIILYFFFKISNFTFKFCFLNRNLGCIKLKTFWYIFNFFLFTIENKFRLLWFIHKNLLIRMNCCFKNKFFSWNTAIFFDSLEEVFSFIIFNLDLAVSFFFYFVCFIISLFHLLLLLLFHSWNKPFPINTRIINIKFNTIFLENFFLTFFNSPFVIKQLSSIASIEV